ncbi:MAG: NeuD/PglB/VioB family sugar acetyltransferase [Phycisphaerales bacterium]
MRYALNEATMHTADMNLVLLGGGGHALVVAEAAALAGYFVTGFYDDRTDAVLARRVAAVRLGSLDDFLNADGATAYIITIGDTATRAALEHRVRRGRPATRACRAIVHPRAIVSPSAELGAGVFVGPGAIVHSFAQVGEHAIINSGAIVEHECKVGEHAHIAPGAVLGGNVSVGRATLLGIGSRVIPRVKVGNECVVGSGAVVIRDVPDRARVVGVPARVMDERP